MTGILDNVVQDKVDIKYQLSDETPSVVPAAKLYSEQIEVREVVTKFESVSIAGAMIWGSPSFGVWGTDEWGAPTGSSFILNSPSFGVLGENQLGAGGTETETYAVVPRDNIYIEYFGQDDYIDTINSTGTLDTSAETYALTTGQILQSDVIAKLRVPITQVQIVQPQNLSDTGVTTGMVLGSLSLGSTIFAEDNVEIEFSNDSGTTWTPVGETEDVITFSTSSTADELKYRITANEAITIDSGIAFKVN